MGRLGRLTGGRASPRGAPRVQVKVKDQSGNEVFFRLKKG